VAADLSSDGHVGDGRRMCIIMADLDDFKTVNDTHGHAVGDQAIVAVAAALRQNLDGASVIGRIGGEEFLIGARLPSDKALAMAESVRAAIASTPFAVTASVGVAIDARGRRGGVELIEHLTARADRAMYSAKRRGGNQVAHLSGTERADQPSPA
jgi:diguanylate cyclase (GGDEF)-like protein